MELQDTNPSSKQRFNWTNKLTSKFQNRKTLPMALFVVGFAVVGVVMLFQSFAQGTSTITGVAFKDMNRNDVQDAGEEPMADHVLYLMGSDGGFIVGSISDSAGRYTFTGIADGNYTVRYSESSWRQIWEQWAPTTVPVMKPEKTVSLVGSATVDFGWRPIVWSTDLENPISSLTAADGLKVASYNDAMTAQEVESALRQGSLIGQEAASVTIRFAQNTSTYCASSVGQSSYCYISYRKWLEHGDEALFHEYGHAWENYWAPENDPGLTKYLQIRGLSNEPRLNTEYIWYQWEIIAEDYRQLFGSANASSYQQANREIPLAKDVPGLREYLAGEFVQSAPPPPSASPTAPTNLTATASSSPEGPSVQLNWTASSGTVDRYDIYRNNVKIGYANSPSTTYYDGTNLQYNATYSYYIKAVDSSGTSSDASNTVGVTTPAPDTTKPSVPTGLMSTGSTNSTVSLQWMAATDNVGVKEYRIYQDSRKLQPVLKGTATGTNFTVTGLKFNSGYMFYVTAVDAAGNESLPSKTLSVKTRR